MPLLRDCDEEGEPTLTKFILRLEDEMDQRLMIALGKRKGGGVWKRTRETEELTGKILPF